MTNDDMNHDLEALLSGAFNAQARSAVPDNAAPPPPRFASLPAASSTLNTSDAAPSTLRTDHVVGAHRGSRVDRLGERRRRHARYLAPLSAAAAVILAVGVGAAVLTGGHDGNPTAGNTGGAAAPTSVHIKLFNGDGQTYGVGMPVIAYFSHAFTDARALEKATTVTVNGKPTDAEWYFEPSKAGNGPIEGHLRPDAYWPARSKIHVDIPARKLNAGRGLAFDNDLTLDFKTGDREIAKVDKTKHTLTLVTNGKPGTVYPVSLGANKTPTDQGIKVIMDQAKTITLNGPGYHGTVAYAQRLTYDGEFLYAAPFNKQIGQIDSSSGSTQLKTEAAKALYAKLRVGDVVAYPKTGGPTMTLGNGFGDWNVGWGEWQTGGVVPTH